MSATAHDWALIEECAAAVIQPESMLTTRERLKDLRGEIAQLTAERRRDVKRGKKSVNTFENERRQDRLYEIMRELSSLTERRCA